MTLAGLMQISAAADLPFAAYVGKYPGDKMAGGTSFLLHPVVIDGVSKAVGDAAVRGWVLREATVQSPIILKDGKLLSQACEPHNCGSHHWTVIVDMASQAVEVCLHDEATMPDNMSRWYAPSGASEMRALSCPH